MDRTEKNLDGIDRNIKKSDKIVKNMGSNFFVRTVKGWFSSTPTEKELIAKQQKEQKKTGMLMTESAHPKEELKVEQKSQNQLELQQVENARVGKNFE